MNLQEATMLALQGKLEESFYTDMTYKVKLFNGEEFNWKPTREYANQDFIQELKTLNDNIKSVEDIESITEL